SAFDWHGVPADPEWSRSVLCVGHGFGRCCVFGGAGVEICLVIEREPMPADQFLLPLLLATPLLGAVAAALLGPERAHSIRRISLVATLVALGLSVVVAYNYGQTKIQGQQPGSVSTAAGTLTFMPEMVPGSHY